MKFIKRFTLSAGQVARDFQNSCAQVIDQLATVVNAIGFGTPASGVKPDNVDGIWLVAQFTAANTDTVFQHLLGRVPKCLLEAKRIPDAGETANVTGDVTVTTWTNTSITLQCTSATKKARLLLL